MTLAPWVVALAFVVGLLVLIPARRLQLSGFSSRTMGLYAVVLWLLAMGVAVRPVGARILVPFLLVLYLAPFVAGPDTVQRVFRRRRPGPLPPGTGGPPGEGRPGGRLPMKDVTPRGPDADS